jgi:hypothetical protein
MKRSHQALNWCLLALSFAAVVLLVSYLFRGNFRLKEMVDALLADGELTCLADLARPPLLPADNAETYLRLAHADIQAILADVDAAYNSLPKAEKEAFDEWRPMPSMLAAMHAAIKAHPDALARVEEASLCPDDDPEVDFKSGTESADFVPAMGNWRSACRFTNCQALVQLDDGQTEDALQTCLAMFRLSRLIDRNPTLVNHLVCHAIDGETARVASVVLRAGPLSPASHAALEQELASFDMPERFRHAVRTERAHSVELFRELSAGTTPNASWLPGFKNSQCDYLDGMAECIRGAALPYSDWKRMNGAIMSRPAGDLAKSMLESVHGVRDADVRLLAQFRALRVLNALLAREEAGAADDPTLADLELPADATTDPFNERPLQLKKLPTGWLIYSVGQNLTDDGGDLANHRDVGVGPPKAASSEASEEAPAP